MKIFISWSKSKSKEFAIATKELLKSVNPHIDAFVSDVDIHAGEDVQKKIIEKIMECDKLVLCFTKENKKSPWLLFEAGFARGIGKNVIPILFDEDPNWHSWIDNPMNIAREITFNSDEIFVEKFLDGFELPNYKSNKNKIENYVKSINDIKEKFRDIDIQCEDFVGKLTGNESFIVENPFFRDKSAHFLTGFESFELLKVIIDSFMYTGKYLWIYGRKNMKLLSGNFQEFFKYLEEKTYSSSVMDGIDFRCLFLDPASDEVERAHTRKEIFVSELASCILRAKDVIKDNKRLQRCFRLYSNRREEIIIRLDNCIIYSRPTFDIYGRPQLLTNTGFEVFSANSAKGQECIRKFEGIWDNAKPF